MSELSIWSSSLSCTVAAHEAEAARCSGVNLNKGKENVSELMAALERFWQPSRRLRPSAKNFERRVREGVLTCEHEEAVVNWTLQHSLDVTDVLMTQNTKW